MRDFLARYKYRVIYLSIYVESINLSMYVQIHLSIYILPCLLAGPSGIRVGTNGRFEAERPPTSVGLPSGERAAFETLLHSLYSTRPHGRVQAIFWHTCPDLDLGPWFCLTHWTHIALSGSMTSRVRVSARSRPSPPLYPHFNRPSGFWPCVKSCLMGGSDKYYTSIYLPLFKSIFSLALKFPLLLHLTQTKKKRHIRARSLSEQYI